jgi:transcription antitermination factor NusG
MILEHLDTSRIKSKQWFMLELRSERTSEETIRRLGKEMKRQFGTEPVEVFIPIQERDHDTFTLLTGCYIFVRADDVQKIAHLRKVTGIECVVGDGGSTRVNKFIKVEDDYVQTLIQRCWTAHYNRSKDIRQKSWVRILDGQMRDFCGYVEEMDGDRVVVKVAAKTKLVLIETSVHNLIDLSHVPAEARVFYYSEPVTTFLEEQGVLAAEAIQSDLAFDPDVMDAYLRQHEVEASVPTPVLPEGDQAVSREQTPTRFVKSMILGGERDVKVMLRETAKAIRAGQLRMPKNATILWHVLRETVKKELFSTDPKVNEYTDIITLYGEQWRVTPKEVMAAVPELALRYVRPAAAPEKPLATHTGPGSKQWVSSMVRGSLEGNKTNLWKVVARIQDGLREDFIKAPKHLSSLVQAIRSTVLRFYKATNPGEDIKALSAHYGKGLYITATEVMNRFPELEALLLQRRAEQTLVKITLRSTERVQPTAPKAVKAHTIKLSRSSTETVAAPAIIPMTRKTPVIKQRVSITTHSK